MDEPDNAMEHDASQDDLARALESQRPVPAARFRGDLRRRLASQDPGYGPRPPHLWPAVLGYLGAGVVLGGLGALSAVGLI